MTDDFKQKILNYLTGTYTTGSGNNNPQFTNVETITNNLYLYLSENVTSTGQYFISSVIQGKNSDNENVDMSVISGYAYDTINSNYFGFIIILDDTFTPIQTIKSYSSGTTLGAISTLNVGDDGYFYGIETTYGTSTKRFIMLNNITVKLPTAENYQVTLRQSYNLPSPISDATNYRIKKEVSKSKYLIVGMTLSNSLYQPIATELTVNVGSTNNWTNYTYTDTYSVTILDFWTSWDSSDNLDFKIGAFTNNVYCEYSRNGTSISKQEFSLSYPSGSTISGYGCVNLSKTNSYVSLKTINGNYNYFYLYKINYTTNSCDEFYEKNAPAVEVEEMSTISLKSNDTDLYYFIICLNTNTNYDCYAGRIIGTTTYEKLVISIDEADMTSLYQFNVTNQFNLYSFYIQIGNKCYMTNQIYNSNNYNGLEYQSLDSMIPNSGILYNSDDVAIFARNLYNKTINNNTTLSVLEVPNTFINDITISKQNLLGKTNGILVNNTQNIVTNIYETLNINFYNTLLMKNDNNTQNEIINNAGASRINNSISDLCDYSNAKATKCKINYDDNTSLIQKIDSATQITIVNGVATYSFVVYVPTNKNISNIQIIGNDETTIYNEITTLTFQNNKYYKINQNLEVI